MKRKAERHLDAEGNIELTMLSSRCFHFAIGARLNMDSKVVAAI